VDKLSSQLYIQNPLELSLSELIGHEGSQYVVVVGPKCCGKSTLVNHVIAANPIGVIPLTMSKSFIGVYDAIAKKLGAAEHDWDKDIIKNIFNNTIQLARRSKRFPSDWVPTIVIELDRATTDESVNNIARDTKLLCSDTRSCRGVLVLSDALAAFAIPKDPRADYFWVDDFTEDLAHQYFDTLNFLTDSSHALGSCHIKEGCPEISANYSLRAKIFSTIGTRVSDLEFIAAKTKSNAGLIDSYISNKISECESTLSALFEYDGKPSGADFMEAARLILKSPTKSVKSASLKNNGLRSPRNAAIVLKQKDHGLLFHIPSQSYRFYSKCHETAASQMEDLK
jgi:energy-coupling factor transporter ATP-binding protein EcfA2